MKNYMIAAISGMALTACWGAPPNDKILTDLCQDVFTGDPQILGEIADESGADLSSFCSCYGETLAADTSKIDVHKAVSSAIIEARDGTTLGAEDAAERVEERIRSGEIDGFTEDQLMQVGSDYQSIMRDMSRNEGVCPVGS